MALIDITEDQNKELDRVKFGLLAKGHVFLTTLAYSLHLQFGDDVKTAGTDGKYIQFNPDFFFNTLKTREERLFVYAHEVWHVAFMHMFRLTNYDPQRWNIACDHYINPMLKRDGFGEPPAGGLYDPEYAKLDSANEIYKLLPASSKMEDMDLSKPCTFGAGGKGDDSEPMMGSDGKPLKGSKLQEAMESEIMKKVLTASITHLDSGKEAGMIPGDIRRALDTLTNPKLPWNAILQQYVNGFAKDDYSWTKPSKRFMPDFILPSLFSETLERISVYVDVSGSVSDEDYRLFMSEIRGMFDMMEPTKMLIAGFTTELTEVFEVDDAAKVEGVPIKGYGGTSIHPVIDHIAENESEVVVIFTDGYYQDPNYKPNSPIVWIIYDNPSFTCDFGKIIHFDKDAALKARR